MTALEGRGILPEGEGEDYDISSGCPFCGMPITYQPALVKHIKMKHMTNSTCPLCGRKFVKERTLLVHLKYMHPWLYRILKYSIRGRGNGGRRAVGVGLG